MGVDSGWTMNFRMIQFLLLVVLSAVGFNCGAAEAYEALTQKEIDAITYEEATMDDGVTIPLRANLEHLDADAKKRFDEWSAKIDDWKPGQEENLGQQVRNWLSLVSVVDICQSEFEGETAWYVFDKLKKDVPKAKLIKITAWIALKPDAGKVVRNAPDLGYDNEQEEGEVRERTAVYSKKLLGRLLGKLPPKE